MVTCESLPPKAKLLPSIPGLESSGLNSFTWATTYVSTPVFSSADNIPSGSETTSTSPREPKSSRLVAPSRSRASPASPAT